MPYKTPNKTSEYIRSLLPQEGDAFLAELLRYADKNMIPVLLPETAAFLRQQIMLKQPQKILEIGTAIGYSAQLMLKASPNSRLYTIEISEKYALEAKKFLCNASLSDRATVLVGDAAEILPFLEEKFDFIFLDGPKAQYAEYLPYLKKLIATGGMIFCDNVLYDGMVSGETNIKRHKSGFIKKIDSFLREIMSDDELVSSILPVGDGVSLSIKK